MKKNPTPDVSQSLPDVVAAIAKLNHNRTRQSIIQFQIKTADLEAIREYAKSQNTDISKLMRAFICTCISQTNQ
ncbi:hypothetical protein WJH60_13890 [Burkholderia orbicola]|uniref:hypothetical protein n=1 Tax=Burkholderia orbicola TaxID=2978683 RepID=UPI0035C78441